MRVQIKHYLPVITLMFLTFFILDVNPSEPSSGTTILKWIRPAQSGSHFICGDAGERFIAWGFNYDHDRGGRLLEDYWHNEWNTIEEDFREMKSLGANVIRIHLQTAQFLKSPKDPDPASLSQLARLLCLAEKTAIYLDITGLGCYHKKNTPEWYDKLNEAERWNAQALFWESVAKICAASPAVFCYDLMNEPILPGDGETADDWLAGEFGGKYFVQRIALDLTGRTRENVAETWIAKLTGAIRKHDSKHMITVGVIPWAYVFTGAKPIFYTPETAPHLDFVSVHFYPQKNETAKALDALKVYDIGKPIVVEEMFPLKCSLKELNDFIEGSRKIADGWLGFYWGKTIEEYRMNKSDIADAITLGWLEYFREKSVTMLKSEKCPDGK